MGVPYESFTGSKPFEFLIGPEKTPFYIHLSLVLQLSKTLETLVAGPMKEAKLGSAHLPDVEPATFNRAIEFAYTGSYSIPQPIKTSKESTTDGAPDFESTEYQGGVQEIRVADPSWAFVVKPTTKEMELWADFVYFSSVFLAYARLYVFADKYGISSLRINALVRLNWQLANFKLYNSRISDVPRLLEYAYENTADLEGALDSLRDLVTDYVACHLSTIGTTTEFLTMLEEPGRMTRDIMLKPASGRVSDNLEMGDI